VAQPRAKAAAKMEVMDAGGYHRQHVVSEVLLNRFAEKGTLMVFDCKKREERRSNPDREGWVRDFIKTDREGAEDRWQEVEGPVGHVLALDAEGEGALARPEAVATLNQLIALHMARARVLADMWNLALGAVLDRRRAALSAQTDLLDSLFHDRFGLHAAGPQARQAAADAVHREVEARLRDGPSFGTQVHERRQGVGVRR
jgi:hypothetical protein